MSVSVNTAPLQRLMKKIQRMPTAMTRMTEESVTRYGNELLESTRRHASGRPGPNVITGEYRASIRLEFRDGGAFVRSDAPQSHRLEYGFVGMDSLGRVYNQPPFPHFAPALAEVRPKFLREISLVPIRAWRSL